MVTLSRYNRRYWNFFEVSWSQKFQNLSALRPVLREDDDIFLIHFMVMIQIKGYFDLKRRNIIKHDARRATEIN